MISKNRNGARERKYEKGKYWKSLYFSPLKQLDWIKRQMMHQQLN